MATTPAPRFRTALLVSIALNVLLIAAIATGVLMRRHGPPGGGPFRLPRAEMVERALPETDRPIVRRLFSAHRGELRERVIALRRARRNVRDVLTHEPFDAAVLDARLATLRERESAIAATAHTLFGELATSVSPEGRAALAKLAAQRGERGRQRRRAADDGEARGDELDPPNP